MLVDSCVDANREDAGPASLQYLADLHVDPSQVRLIVATHWHDDHIRGLAQILQTCRDARFYCSAAFRRPELLKLVKAMETSQLMEESSGIREFGDVLTLLARRRKAGSLIGDAPGLATANKMLHRSVGPPASTVTSLSPSDAAIRKSLEGFAQLLPKPLAPKRRVASPSSNDASVVLWVEMAETAVLLGADLETTPRSDMGWKAIVASTERPTGRASVFKVAHHGSRTGHHQPVWLEMLHDQPLVATTPYANGRHRLPTATDRARIADLSHDAFLAGALPGRGARMDSPVERTVREMTKRFSRAQGAIGHVRMRKRVTDADSEWETTCFGAWERMSAAA